jgi:hypothetical protein
MIIKVTHVCPGLTGAMTARPCRHMSGFVISYTVFASSTGHKRGSLLMHHDVCTGWAGGLMAAQHHNMVDVCHVLLAWAFFLRGSMLVSGNQGGSCAAMPTNSRRYNFQVADYNVTTIEDGALTFPINASPFAAPVSDLRRLLKLKFMPEVEVRPWPSFSFGNNKGFRTLRR